MKRWWIPLAIAGCLASGSAWAERDERAERAERAEMLTVAVDSANFRDGPSTQHDVLYTADRYYTVEVIEKKDDWVKTRDFEGDVAWVATRLLERNKSVVVHVPCALVRQGPDKDTAVAFKVDRGEGMLVNRKQGAWLQVTNVDGVKGWVHRDVVWGDLGGSEEK